MTIVAKDRIVLQATAIDRADAIQQAGELLIKAGCIQPEYVAGMLAREQSMSTSLGNGVAIPHGMNESRAYILQTGISVVQFPGGVDWDEGEKVYLVIGIAAASDEHVGVLANLAEVIEDEHTLNELLTTTDPEVIVGYLSANTPVESSDPAGVD